MDKKKLPKKHIILLFCSAALLVVNLIFYSLGWFTSNKETETNGIGMKAINKFKIIGLGSDETEENINTQLVDYLTKNGYDTDIQNDIFWLLGNDNNINNRKMFDVDQETGNKIPFTDREYGIEPGSFGTLKFKVITEKDLKLKFKLSVYPQYSSGFSPEDAVEAEKFLKSHIMFFNSFNSAKNLYSNKIKDSVYSESIEFEANQENIITIHWIWPETFGQVILESDDYNLHGNSVLFENSFNENEEWIVNSDKALLLANMYSKPYDYFFRGDVNDAENYIAEKDLTDSLQMLNAISSNPKKNYSSKYYATLCQAYNKADEELGNKIPYIIIKLEAEEDTSEVVNGD